MLGADVIVARAKKPRITYAEFQAMQAQKAAKAERRSNFERVNDESEEERAARHERMHAMREAWLKVQAMPVRGYEIPLDGPVVMYDCHDKPKPPMHVWLADAWGRLWK